MKLKNVHLFIFDGFSDWEPGYAIAGINNPQFQQQPGRYRVQTVGPGNDPVVSMGGLRVEPDLPLASLSPDDSAMLILPGGVAWEEGRYRQATETAQAFLDAGIPVAAICGATVALARAGLLDHRRHTSNAPEYLAATQYHGTALYTNASAVADENLITASGVASVDFARQIFRRLDLYTPAVLEAWYQLFKTGRPEHFDALLEAASMPADNVG